jgi:hypothetical protein
VVHSGFACHSSSDRLHLLLNNRPDDLLMLIADQGLVLKMIANKEEFSEKAVGRFWDR